MRFKITLYLILLFIFQLLFPNSGEGGSETELIRWGEDVDLPRDQIAEEIVVIGGDVLIGGEVRKDVVVIGGDIILKSTSIVGGNVVDVGGSIEREEGAQIKGEEISLSAIRLEFLKSLSKISIDMKSLWGWLRLIWLLGVAIIVVILILALPRPVEDTLQALNRDPLRAFLVGLIAFVALIPLTILLLLSLIGILLIPLLFLIILGLSIFGVASVSLLIGRRIRIAFNIERLSSAWEVLIGLAFIYLLQIIPLIGGIAYFLISLLGLGGIITIILERRGGIQKQVL